MRGMARPAGLEPATSSLEGTRSIQLSYGRRIFDLLFSNVLRAFKNFDGDIIFLNLVLTVVLSSPETRPELARAFRLRNCQNQ